LWPRNVNECQISKTNPFSGILKIRVGILLLSKDLFKIMLKIRKRQFRTTTKIVLPFVGPILDI
jgi:hypothetical protein